MTEETRKIIDEKIEKISKYQKGDKFVVEIKESGYPYSVIGERRNCSEEFLDSLDRLDSDYINEHFGELQDEAYNQGLNDGRNEVWELSKRIIGILDKENHELIPAKELIKIYGSNDLLDIFAFIPQEALAKLKAYEDSRFEVGDVVKVERGVKFVVTHISKGGEYLFGICATGDTYSSIHKRYCKKTGKHIDIQSILEQIGGE